jgi:hypothetical protein
VTGNDVILGTGEAAHGPVALEYVADIVEHREWAPCRG